MDASNQSRVMSPLPNLPPDIITEILLFLPVKSILRFKSVCKSWLSLISSSKFIKAHLHHSTKSNNYLVILDAYTLSGTYYTCSLSSILCNTLMYNFRVFYIPSTCPSYNLRYVGTCNGLICVSVDPHTLVVYNPSIRNFKTLPVSGTEMDTRVSIRLGFCYDEYNDDYKVVELCQSSDTTSIGVKVYSLRNDSWRIIEHNYGGFMYRGDLINVGGILHCFIRKDGGPFLIFAVNTVIHRCDTLAPPTQLVRVAGVAESGLVELDGRLGFFCDNYCDRVVNVWAMKEYGVKESWSKLFSIPYLANHPIARPLFMLKNGDTFFNNGKKMMLYNSRRNLFTTHGIHTTGGMCSVADLIVPMYIESLVSTSLVADNSRSTEV